MPWFRRILLAALALCFCVVVFGAYVRLSDAGLGCPDWPGCYGHVGVPEADHELAQAQSAFPQRPVEAHKAWKEMIHRYLASTLGLLIVVLALLSLRLPQVPRRLPWVLVVLVIFQGLLGMWTVTLLLKPLVVTGHLLGGLTTLSLLLWLRLSLQPPAVAAARPERELRSERHAAFDLQQPAAAAAASSHGVAGLRRFAAVALVLVALQIFLGGWTSTNYAALGCPDFPTCHGRWLPETDFPTAFTLWHGLGIDYEHGILDNRARLTIHLTHRIGALVVTAVLIALALALLRRREMPLRRYGAAVLAALALQIALGISIVLLQLPLLLAAAHNAGAAILLSCLVALNHRLRPSRMP